MPIVGDAAASGDVTTAEGEGSTGAPAGLSVGLIGLGDAAMSGWAVGVGARGASTRTVRVWQPTRRHHTSASMWMRLIDTVNAQSSSRRRSITSNGSRISSIWMPSGSLK
jgi:hypothetical protein